MRIGIDFDNTLIRYHELFHELARARGWIPASLPVTKDAVREHLITRDGHDRAWQALQAEAYGREIHRAPPFAGAEAFLREARARGDELFIVSHKSETSHLDPSARLRESAWKWLESRALGIPAGQVHFLSTRDEKVAKIRELALDVYVDDLREVLEHPDFPAGTERIWFTPDAPVTQMACRSWAEVALRLRFRAELGTPPWEWLQSAAGGKLAGYELLSATGNNRLYALTLADGRERVLKKSFARADVPGRAALEFAAAQLMWQGGERDIPEPLSLHAASSAAVYSRLPGHRPRPEDVTSAHLRQAAEFLLRLHRRAAELPADSTYAQEAADSRTRLQDYRDHVARRWQRILDNGKDSDQVGAEGAGAPPEVAEIHAFLDTELRPLRELIERRFSERLAQHGLSASALLPRSARTLSPSDFGFHNTLIDDTGRVRFVDFEYFGWDDPAKLIADFFHSVAQSLRPEQKWEFFDHYTQGLADPAAFVRRWECVVDLVGLEWILIVLNVADPRVLARRKFAQPSLDERALLRERLTRARSLSAAIRASGADSRFLTLPERDGAA